MKTFDIQHEILVRAPIQRVFEVWTDFEHFPDLYPEVYDSIKVYQQGENVVTDEIIKTIAGKQSATVRTRLEPPLRYFREFIGGAMEGSTRNTTLEQTPEGTLVKTQMNVRIGGLAATFLGDLAETLFLKNLEKLSRAHAAVAEQV